MYLRSWGTQYETLDYPPAAGPYAVYQKSDFFLTVGYAITRYNQTRELAVGEYSFVSSNPNIALCQTNLLDATDDHGRAVSDAEEQYCILVYPLEIEAISLFTAESVKQFLADHNFTIDFSRLLTFSLRFSLLSPVVTRLGPSHDPECFRFDVYINMEKSHQAGLLAIHLHAPYAVAPCTNLDDIAVSTEELAALSPDHSDLQIKRLQLFWSQFSDTGQPNRTVTWHSFSMRRISIILLQVTALLLGVISLILCIRSVVRNFCMWKDTVLFFKHWYSIELYGYFWYFIPLWFMVIITNDIMIIVGSIYNLWSISKLRHKPEPISYVLGVSALLVWSGILRYVGFSYSNSILMRTIFHSVPALLRFGVCSLIMFFAFSLCGWVVLGPYNLKFRTFISTLECLYSLINGDDMYVTFSVIGDGSPWGIYIFSRLFLYTFITLFIYVVLNLFITIIFEAYTEVKQQRDTFARPHNSPLFAFIRQNPISYRSPQYKRDDIRPDRKLLRCFALGRHFGTAPTTIYTAVSVDSGKESVACDETKHRLLRAPPTDSQPSVGGGSSLACSSQLTSAGSSSVSFVSQRSSSSGLQEEKSYPTDIDNGVQQDYGFRTPTTLLLQHTVFDALGDESELDAFMR
ncbi:unnamed protein product [Dicrocoelium dendriticum]|nr:unnamed protein product [Dicrocoelium dendriticum]